MNNKKSNLKTPIIIISSLLILFYIGLSIYFKTEKDEAIGIDIPNIPKDSYVINTRVKEVEEETEDNDQTQNLLSNKAINRLNKINNLSDIKTFVYVYEVIEEDRTDKGKDYSKYLNDILEKIEDETNNDIILLAMRIDSESNEHYRTIDIVANDKTYKKIGKNHLKNLNLSNGDETKNIKNNETLNNKVIEDRLDEIYRLVKFQKDNKKPLGRSSKEKTIIAFVISIIVLILIVIIL